MSFAVLQAHLPHLGDEYDLTWCFPVLRRHQFAFLRASQPAFETFPPSINVYSFSQFAVSSFASAQYDRCVCSLMRADPWRPSSCSTVVLCAHTQLHAARTYFPLVTSPNMLAVISWNLPFGPSCCSSTAAASLASTLWGFGEPVLCMRASASLIHCSRKRSSLVDSSQAKVASASAITWASVQLHVFNASDAPLSSMLIKAGLRQATQ